VRAGEATGQLGDMLRRTVEAMDLDAGMRSKLRSAMIYPGIMLTLTISVLVFLLTWIVPKFEKLLRGKVLPKPTQLLLALGDACRDYGYWMLGGTALLVLGVVLFLRTARGARWLDQAMLHLPVLAGIYRTAVLGRSARTFGLLLQAGVPMHAALDHTQEVAGSLAYRKLWRDHVVNGGSLLAAIRGQPLFGPSFEQLVAAGESTATLDRVLGKVAEQYTKDLERRVRDLLTLIEPAMVVLMGAIVGFVALSIMLPIFQISRGGGS
jgi:type II secretory pathway component PulF